MLTIRNNGCNRKTMSILGTMVVMENYEYFRMKD